MNVASGDILTLATGGTVEGEIIQKTADAYVVRTVVGTVKLPVQTVQKVEPSPSPFQEYDRLRADVRDTAEAHFKLAQWCDERGLAAEKAFHLRRAIEIDPDHAPAREASGQVRVGQLWVDAKPGAEKLPPDAGRKSGRKNGEVAPAGASPASRQEDPPAGEGESQPTSPTKAGNPEQEGAANGSSPNAAGSADPPDDARDDERLAQAVQNTWLRKIRAIKSSLLDSSIDRLVKDGRRKILEIRDPLAILPLARVLSRGNIASRELLVESLAGIDDDEATLNLAVMALVDGDAGVREAALAELARRKDERVPAQFRKALASGNEPLICRAATALGYLKRPEAVPDLIKLLTARRRQMVDVPVRKYFGELPREFCGETQISVGGSSSIFRRPQIGVTDATGFVTIQWEKQRQVVTLFRSEVRDALVQITGVDKGFDADAWQAWYHKERDK